MGCVCGGGGVGGVGGGGWGLFFFFLHGTLLTRCKFAEFCMIRCRTICICTKSFILISGFLFKSFFTLVF